MQPLEQNKCPDCIFKTCNNCVKKAYVAVFEQPLEQDWLTRFDEMTNIDKCPYESIRDSNLWLKEKTDLHLFEEECYGEPMFDLSAEKVKNFIRVEKQKSFEDGLRRARELVPEECPIENDIQGIRTAWFYKGFNACREEFLKAIDKLK